MQMECSRLLKKLVPSVGIVVLLSACSAGEEGQGKQGSVYPLAALINAQIEMLNSQKPLVRKVVTMGDLTDEVETREVDWADELEFFLQADINKPSIQASFEQVKSDTATTYRLKEGEKYAVKELTIVSDTPDALQQTIYATTQTENYLFKTERQLKLELSRVDNTLKIVSYQVDGLQDVIFAEPKKYTIKGTIL